MSLFKPLLGNSTRLPEKLTDGWAYFCTDTGEFFIDFADENGDLHRKQINAEEAKRITNVTGVEGQFVGFDSNGNLVSTDNPTGAVQDALTSHISDTNNPHCVTAEQLGLDGAMMLSENESRTAQLTSTAKWISVTYGNDKFVAVSYSGNISYSTDGITWFVSNPPSGSGAWRSVTYGNGRFVAVAGASNFSDEAAYSDDGINWTSTTLPSSTYWQSVSYGNNRFVTVGSPNKAAYSDDGINWYEGSIGSSQWQSIAYGNGRFVVITNGSPIAEAAYSDDGINWISTKMPLAYVTWQSVAYGNGRFVAIASMTIAAYSDDGINWVRTNQPIDKKWKSIAYGNGCFVAVANDYDKACYSEDGINWAETPMPRSAKWCSITYGNGKFVAIIESSTSVAISYDGITWYETVPGETILTDSTGTDITENIKALVAPDMTGLATETFVTEAIAAIPEPDLSSKQDKLTGTEGQTVEFDSEGNLIAVDKVATGNGAVIRVW